MTPFDLCHHYTLDDSLANILMEEDDVIERWVITRQEILRRFNAFHAAGECRRQFKNVTKCVKKFQIVEFHDHI